MKDEFIPYEEARLLKGLGFNEPCLRYYWEGATELMGDNTNPKTNWELTDLSNSDLKELQGTVFMTAPLYQQAFRWFRDDHDLQTSNIMFSNGKYDTGITRYKGTQSVWGYGPIYDTYEEAELECLKKLIEIVKNKENENNNQ